MKRSLAALLAAFVVLVAAPALGQPGYVPIIDSTLGVQVEAAEPTQGCQLCHTDANGGTTSLRPFGQLMVSKYGLISSVVETAGADASLKSALQAMAADQPQVVQDLHKGIDPNPDVTNDPTPAYGCAIASDRSESGAVLALTLGALGMLAVRAARRKAATQRATVSR